MKPKTGRTPGGELPRGRVFRLTYSNARPDDDPKLFRCRDAMAFCELAAALPRERYDYGTTIHFYPDDDRGLVDFPPFEPADVLVLTTRPPLHDKNSLIPPRRVIHATKTELEAVLFEELGKYFAFCSRKFVDLTPHAVACLKVAEPQKWASLELFEYGGANIQRHHVGHAGLRPQANHDSTIVFFLRANHLPKIQCDFVASFGMDGYATLIWNRLIRHRFPEWLDGPRFVMAELVYRKPIPVKPLTPAFADDPDAVEVRVLT
ncbi:MAG: hypothetical protein HS113_13700 [Verrucomicrobiales bacterium]|nr:hypothetical protein [Verrucomicrobiales bacterium]